ncbi:WD40 repeat domain-containing protein [Candidatus Poribacteria bacterium]|nr:WD40 repeat domain-containing protein [Candidatus Poribacteria bacterium]
MKPKVFFSLMLLILSTFLYVSDTTAENEPYTQWSLPDGAKARLGKGGVNDITCSPDGTLLVVASQIGIWIYDIQTGKEIALLTGHAVAVDRVAFSPDRRTLASGGQDNTVRLWDVNTQTEIATLEGHTGGPDSIWFSPDGRILASRGNDNTLRLWDVDTQMQIRTLEGHTGSVESVAFSPDGKTLANGGQDNIVRLWDVETRTEISTLQGHAGYARSVSFSPDGRTLASGSNDIRLWDMETQTQIGRLEGHTGLVNSVAFSPDGRTLVSGSSWGEVHLWDMETQTRSSILEGSSFRHITGVSFSPDGNTIAYKYPWVTDSVSFLNVNTLSRSSGGFFEHTWEVLWVIDTLVDAQRKNIHTILQGHTGTVESISFSPDGRTIAASGVDNYNFIRMWDIASLTEINILDRWDYRFSNKNVSFSPDGKRILSRCGQYVICLRDAATYTEISRLEIPSNWWVSIAVFSPDGRTLAILSHDHESPIYGSPIVRLWNVDTDTEIGELWGHIGQVQSVSFSPDGRTLATAGSIDGTVRLWDVDTLAEIAILRGHTGGSTVYRSVQTEK